MERKGYDVWLISQGHLNISTFDPSVLPPPCPHWKAHRSFITRWVFVSQLRMGTKCAAQQGHSFHDAQSVGSLWSKGTGSMYWVDPAKEVTVWPYKAVVPAEARLSLLHRKAGLWAFPDDICGFSDTQSASLAPCTALVVQLGLGKFFVLWNLYIFNSDISKIVTESFLSGWFTVKQKLSPPRKLSFY